MSGEYEHVGTRYAVILPNQHFQQEISEVLNGLQERGIISVYRTREEIPAISNGIKLFDLTEKEVHHLGSLNEELRKEYRPDEVIYMLEQFVGDGNWQHQARLHRQQNDRNILDEVLHGENAAPSTLVREFIRNQGRSPELTNELAEHLKPLMESHKYKSIANFYGGVPIRLARDFWRICRTNALKAYVDCHDDPSTSSVHTNLLEQVILKRKFFERLPESEYPIDQVILNKGIERVYTELKPLETGKTVAEMTEALPPGALEQIKSTLRRAARESLLKKIGQPHSLETLLRHEERIAGPSKNPVFIEEHSIADEAKVYAVTKVFDRRNPATAESKQKEFTNEIRAVRYFERVGLLDSMHFTWGSDDGISILTMNYLDGRNLIDVMKTATPDIQYQLAEDVMKQSAKFHAYGPANLARDASGSNPKNRAKVFADRITGDSAFFFPNVSNLLASQGHLMPDAAVLEKNIRSGLDDVLTFLADATEYDGTYCDVNWRNWYVKEQDGAFNIYAKRDFGTLKIVPLLVDVSTLFVVGDYARDKRDQLYLRYRDEYNANVDIVNRLVDQRWKHARHFLMTQFTQDMRKAREQQLTYDLPEGVLVEAHNLVRYHTTDTNFSLKETLHELEHKFIDNEEAHQYIEDIGVYMEALNLPKRKKFPLNEEQFLLLARAAEVKRGLVMTGFFAESALEHGLSAENYDYINVTLKNALTSLETLAGRPEFKRSKDAMLLAYQALDEIRAGTQLLVPTNG